MGVMDKFLNYMKLNDEDNEDYYDYDDYDEGNDQPHSSRKSGKSMPLGAEKAAAEVPEDKSLGAVKKSLPKATPMRPTKKIGDPGMEVCVIKPTSVEEAREITETLLANRTVVLNLEGLDVDIAQRIIDFTSGSCFAISGNLQKISHSIFIITPASVDISGDFQEIFSGSSFDVPIHNN